MKLRNKFCFIGTCNIWLKFAILLSTKSIPLLEWLVCRGKTKLRIHINLLNYHDFNIFFFNSTVDKNKENTPIKQSTDNFIDIVAKERALRTKKKLNMILRFHLNTYFCLLH